MAESQYIRRREYEPNKALIESMVNGLEKNLNLLSTAIGQMIEGLGVGFVEPDEVLPIATEEYRGKFYILKGYESVNGDGGTPDTLYVCYKKADDGYAWGWIPWDL